MSNVTTQVENVRENGSAAPANDWTKSPDKAGSDGKETADSPKPVAVVVNLIRRFGSVSDALRLFGALAVAAAMGLYLLDGVQVVNDIQRFFTILGLTAALMTAGLTMSLWLREQRSSRVFIGLALLSVPVNFTVFGALLYSVFPLDNYGFSYPQFALWQVDSLTGLVMAAAAGIVVLVPVAWFAFAVLARASRNRLTIGVLLSGSILLIPVRHELFAAVLVLLAIPGIWWFCKTRLTNSVALKTAEGRFAVALLFVAPAIVVARSMFLYQLTGLLGLAVAGGCYFVARQLLLRRSETEKTSPSFLSGCLTLTAIIAGCLSSVSIYAVVANYLSHTTAFIVANMSILLLLADVMHTSSHKSVARKLGAIVVTLVTIGLVAHSVFMPSLPVAMIHLSMLLLVAGYGYVMRYPVMSCIALTGTVVLALAYAETLWHSVVQTGWWGVALGGAAAIVAGSLLDRAGTAIEVKSAFTESEKAVTAESAAP